MNFNNNNPYIMQQQQSMKYLMFGGAGAAIGYFAGKEDKTIPTLLGAAIGVGIAFAAMKHSKSISGSIGAIGAANAAAAAATAATAAAASSGALGTGSFSESAYQSNLAIQSANIAAIASSGMVGTAIFTPITVAPSFN